jgi:formate/nitrite transporter FocA (FNT family)
MPLLRLAYAAEFLIALIAVFMLWSEAGGQSHLDLLPWYVKLVLGAGAALATVKATVSSVEGATSFNAGALKWLGITLLFLMGCGFAAYYAHLNLEPEEDQQGDEPAVALVISRDVSRSGSASVRLLPPGTSPLIP